MLRSRQAALVALALTAVAVGTAPAASDPSRRRPDARARDARAVHAAQGVRSPVTVTLDSGTVEWRAAPYAEVGAFWYSGESFYFNAFGSADSTGRVVLTWTDPTPERTDDDRPFEEIDRLVLRAGTAVDVGAVYTITLPSLDAEVDAPGDRIALRGPPGATLAVRVRRALDRDVLALTGTDVVRRDAGDVGGALAGQRSSGEPGRSVWAGNVTAGGDGATEVRLAGTVDVQPGDIVEVQRVWAGDTFVLRRTAFQLVTGDGLRQPVAYGRPGERVAVDVQSGGRRRGCATTIGRAGWRSWSCGEPIAAGDRITVSHSGGLLPLVRTTATVPQLAFRPGAGSKPADLTGPPNARLRFVEVDALGGPSGFDVVLDAQGQATLPAGRPARGSRYAYAWRDVSGITWGRGGFMPQIRLVLGEPRLRGVWPADPVTVTVSGRGGAVIGRWSRARTSSGSARSIPLYDPRSGPQGPLHRLAPGERIEVVVGGDEPVVWTVPDLALQFDADRNQLTGRLPLGTRGTLTVLEAIDGDPDPLQPLDDLADSRFVHRATLSLSPATDGAFAVRVSDLRTPDGFRLPAHRLVLYAVTAERADGNAVMAVVARPWLRIDAQSVSAEGFGPSGQTVEIEVADAAGRPIVHRRADDAIATAIDRPVWGVPLVDAVGAPTALRPGDRVTVTVGASRSALTVPPTAAFVDLPGRSVRGRTAPNASLTIAFLGEAWGERRWVVRAGPDGAFETPLPAGVPLRHNDRGEILGRVGPHVVTAQIVVPSMIADLSVGRIWGRGAAGAPVDVTVLRQGRAVALGRRLVDDGLTFDVDPHDAGGRHVRPLAGDVVVQRVDGRPALTLTVPALAARWVQADDAIVGTSPPGSAVDVQRPAGLALTGAGWDVGYPVVAASGAYTASAHHRFGLTTGLSALVQARVPEGVIAWRWVATPVLNVPHGGDSVCGQAMPWAVVHATATLGDGRTAEGSGGADPNGRFRIPLRRADGRPVVLAAGNVVRAVVDGTALEATLPALTFKVDRAARRGTGSAPPGAIVSIEHPAGSCASRDSADPIERTSFAYASEATADGRGAYDAALPLLPRALESARPPAFEAALLDAAGHRHFRLSRALRITALVDTDRVTGEADAGRSVAVTLARPGGLTARGTAVADALGRFTATLAADGGGGTVRLQAGDSVAATADGEARGLTVPPLAVDWHPVRGLEGRTDAGATVHVRFTLPRGLISAQATDVAFALTADAAGRFASAAAAARGHWTATDVRRVEVWRSFEEDDRAMVAFDTERGPAPSPPPGGPTPVATARPPDGVDGGRVLLPWAGREADAP